MLKEMARQDVVITGGGTGGIAAALALSEQGKRVVMTEEYPWIGGQLTSQAVPPDEHPYFDRPHGYGGTKRYKDLRRDIRNYYKNNYPLTREARENPYLNPGNGWVGPVCAEFPVFLYVLNTMLEPHLASGNITLLTHTIPTEAEVDGDIVRAVTVKDLLTGDERVLTGEYFIDATECGDLLPLTGTEYVTGAESWHETGEPSAPEVSDTENVQGFTYTFAMDYLPDEDHTIDKPEMYDFWREHVPTLKDPWPGKQLSWITPEPWTLEPEEKTLFANPGDHFTKSLWNFRQILDKNNFEPGSFESSISLVNWPQNDYWLGRIYDIEEDGKQRSLYEAKQLSLSLLYWMQTEAPHTDGSDRIGYPGLRIRPDMMGTEDGLAQAPYVRESRRIKAEYTLTEQDIAMAYRGGHGPQRFTDSVGIRSYKMDLHPTTGGDNYYDVPTYDSQIPLGILIPRRIENLIPAEKNVGTTHITNGGTRLHPIVWNIGEAAGELAGYCLDHKSRPRKVRTQIDKLVDFQKRLLRSGFELEWPIPNQYR